MGFSFQATLKSTPPCKEGASPAETRRWRGTRKCLPRPHSTGMLPHTSQNQPFSSFSQVSQLHRPKTIFTRWADRNAIKLFIVRHSHMGCVLKSQLPLRKIEKLSSWDDKGSGSGSLGTGEPGTVLLSKAFVSAQHQLPLCPSPTIPHLLLISLLLSSSQPTDLTHLDADCSEQNQTLNPKSTEPKTVTQHEAHLNFPPQFMSVL